ncbi:hypothetical protein BLOT_004172 [Blomia tropicalis]|nr:hypothetical protein BLOT_004172 [Blomia tropicalis]
MRMTISSDFLFIGRSCINQNTNPNLNFIFWLKKTTFSFNGIGGEHERTQGKNAASQRDSRIGQM